MNYNISTKRFTLDVWQGSEYASDSCITAKKLSFPLRISSVNVTKSAGICLFGHIY